MSTKPDPAQNVYLGLDEHHAARFFGRMRTTGEAFIAAFSEMTLERSPRAVFVVGVTLCEIFWRETLRAICVHSPTGAPDLCLPTVTESRLSADWVFRCAFSFGYMNEENARELHLLRSVRNDLAHNLELVNWSTIRARLNEILEVEVLEHLEQAGQDIRDEDIRLTVMDVFARLCAEAWFVHQYATPLTPGIQWAQLHMAGDGTPPKSDKPESLLSRDERKKRARQRRQRE